MTPDLLLDPVIKLWVLVPMLFVMILVGLARHYATELLQPTPPQANQKQLKESAYIQYASFLRGNSFNLGPERYNRIVSLLVPGFKSGAYLADPDAKPPSGMPSLVDPQSSEVLVNGVRSQVMAYVPQTLVMQWVTAFFGGFVVMKLPFPLTSKFKDMLQANLGTHDLDVRWVSSISWYILLLIGLGGVYSLILGRDNQASEQMTQTQGTLGPMMPNVDKRKVFESEAEILELQRPKYVLSNVRQRVLQMEI